MPQVSVVIPSYNHARYIGEAISSVLHQTLADLELIIIDDGSRDDSLSICRGFDDHRVTVVAQENRGAHAALNRGMDLAKGRYIAVLNSDDRFAPTRLQRLVEELEAAPNTVLAGSWVQVVDAAGAALSVKEGIHTLDPWPTARPELTFKADTDLSLHLLMSNFWATTSNYVFRRTLLADIGGFRALRFAHDWDFAFRAQTRGGCVLVPEPLLDYRIHGTNTIRSDTAAMVYEVCWVLAQHLPQYATHAALDVADPHALRLAMERLHHSLYGHGQDRVLLLMLAFCAAARQRGEAVEAALLEPGNPAREWLLGLIRANLLGAGSAPSTEPEAVPGALEAPRVLVGLGRRLRAAWKAIVASKAREG